MVGAAANTLALSQTLTGKRYSFGIEPNAGVKKLLPRVHRQCPARKRMLTFVQRLGWCLLQESRTLSPSPLRLHINVTHSQFLSMRNYLYFLSFLFNYSLHLALPCFKVGTCG